MKILQVNTYDHAGGAEQVAWQLFEAYAARGHDSWLAVGKDTCAHRDVHLIEPAPYAKFFDKTIGHISRKIRKKLGHQICRSPGSWRLMNLPPQRPQIIHAHNLHSEWGYFDLRALPHLSRQAPFALTLHDAWLTTGHCAHSFNCERWRTGCGECPDLTIYPPIAREATEYNWRQRKAIFERSSLFVATPSKWLMQKVAQSILAPAIVDAQVIPNGIDLSLFKPGEKTLARKELGLPLDKHVLLFTANGVRRNPWKDFQMLRTAIAGVSELKPGLPLHFMALGETAPPEKIGAATIQFVPFELDSRKVVRYYQAADVYLHAARADTFPTVVLEAMACGCPVVATAVGGIPEQVVHESTGFQVPAGQASAMAERIVELLGNDSLRARMGAASVEHARKNFDLDRQVDRYLSWYEKILAQHSGAGSFMPFGGTNRVTRL